MSQRQSGTGRWSQDRGGPQRRAGPSQGRGEEPQQPQQQQSQQQVEEVQQQLGRASM